MSAQFSQPLYPSRDYANLIIISPFFAIGFMLPWKSSFDPMPKNPHLAEGFHVHQYPKHFALSTGGCGWSFNVQTDSVVFGVRHYSNDILRC